MAIIRSALPFEAFYTQIPNAFLRDGRLSLRARGLLAQIMSHRAEWRITIESLVRDNPEGRDAMRKAIAELKECGYLVVRARQDNLGRFDGQDYALTDPFIPGTTELLKTRSTEEPPSGESDTKNTRPQEDHLPEDQTQEISTSVTYLNAGDQGDDGRSYPQTHTQFVDRLHIASLIERKLGRTASDLVVMEICGTVLARAKSYPKKPTEYVAKAIERDAFGWQKFIDGGKIPK